MTQTFGDLRLVLGTAAFSGHYAGRRLRNDEALALLRTAYFAGIQWFDTAPGYGSAEDLLGVYGDRLDVHVATKLPHLASAATAWRYLAASQRSLRRQVLDLVQLHSAPVSAIEGSHAMDVLREAKVRGDVALIGATVYDAPAAHAAIRVGLDVVQVPYNLLDRRMAASGANPVIYESVLTHARTAGVTVLARSVWLRGALARRMAFADVPLATQAAADQVRRRLLASWEALPALALRYALSAPFQGVAAAVIGPTTEAELLEAVRAAQAGPLPIWRRILAATLSQPADAVVDPRRWEADAL